MPRKFSDEERVRVFWERVDHSGGPDACWPWTRYRLPKGYGLFGGTFRTYAHRCAYELTNGPIPDGLCVLHRCDNPPCCNPAHLFLGTVADNNEDARRKGRMATGDRNGSRTHPERRAYGDASWLRRFPERNPAKLYPERVPRGEASPKARLTEAAVREIRQLRADGMSAPKIAARFSVATTTVRLVLNGTTWRHVA